MHTPPVWRIARENARLIGYRCRRCGFVEFPEPRKTCKRCRAPAEFEEISMGTRGKIVSFVVQHRLPEGFETPLPLAVIDLENGARVYGQIVECKPEELTVGLEVEADFRVFYDDAGLRVYSYKFHPVRG
ncbi:MAG: Zn-ribbon domain-containing OB-fold protein [Candidatus Bipolaricaulota bacterium]|nr:Zn-ribbon domain-containing OB-fold protein [Candidatus Bipolaricaulota bacterium]MCS7274613.1 Zn-ribbon domain-containing OB-fold protein [Candidatus Bipolaricaulota bacterium]MDW8110956.1 Zn-ribbon domain-containing OB-fold protein [Candidatus Bipolaricaulota bacterium]MDW8329043.1 Zn-ribbon domain-containing OB-fold protein [Candidatus Bipolaricaulota bacterium]